MDRSTFAHVAATKTTHRWFTGRRPVAIVYRVGERTLDMDPGNQERNLPGPLNAALGALFRLESTLVRRGVAIPFGLSYAAVFRRRT